MDIDTTKRAREIFLELSTLDASELNDEIDRLVEGDRDLKEAVIALLDARAAADADDFMGSPTASLAPGLVAETAGAQVGAYKLLQGIGEGGFGSVFLAEQHQPVRRRVALKIIKLGMDTKQIIARFEAERQALALMDHPHIARVFDAGATDSGRPYFAMEYVVGDAITKFADAYKLDIPARLALFGQVCSAVQHAHTKGVIHRDLKPANVLVSMVDGKPFAKVIDFGIAKATASPLTEKTLFTEHRQLIGTPEYMSPEQADGSPDIDTRTDVYALGVLLYELLTGETPFDAKRLRSAAWGEMQRIIREEEPPAPSLRLSRDLGEIASTAAARGVEPTRLSTAVRGELDWVVMKSLEKDRARRYHTPAEFAEDLERHLRGEPVVAAPQSRVYKAKKFVRRNKGPVIAAAAIAATLLVGLAGTAWGWRNALDANRTLEQGRSTAQSAIIEILLATIDFDDAEHASLVAGGMNEEDARRAQAEAYAAGMRDALSHPPEADAAPSASVADIDVLARLAERNVREVRDLNDKFREQHARAEEGLGKMLGIATDGRPRPPIAQYRSSDGGRLGEEDPLGFAIDAGIQMAQELYDQREAALWSAYAANLALAQTAMDADDWSAARAFLADCPESKRGWEWRFLHERAHSVLSRHFGSRTGVSPLGDRIAIVDGTSVSFLDSGGNNVGGHTLHKGAFVWSGLFSEDGTTCAIRFDPDESPIGDVESTRVVAVDSEQGWAAADIPGRPFAIAPDGSCVVIWTQEIGATSGLFDRSGRLMVDFGDDLEHSYEYNKTAAFAPDGETLIATGKGGLVIVDIATESTQTLSVEGSRVAWSPSGQRFALTTGDAIHLYSRAGELELVIPDPDDRFTSTWLAFAGEERLVAGKHGYDIAAWDLNGNEIVSVTAPRSGWWDMAVSPSGTHCSAVSKEETLIIDLTDGTVLRLDEPADSTPTVAFTQLGSALAVHRDGVVSILDLEGELLERVELNGTDQRAFVQVTEQEIVLRTVDDYGVEWFHAAVEALPRPLRSPIETVDESRASTPGPTDENKPAGVEFSAGVELPEFDRRVEVDDGAIRILRIADEEEVCTLRLHKRAESVARGSDGTSLLVTCADGSILELRTPDH